jgi:3'(2'), 5'-bisphosphate nucleotidase
MIYEMERYVAVESVLKACKLCQSIQSTHLSLGVITKSDRSPVTVADFGAQALISDCLKASFPDVLLVAEEDSRLLCQEENADLKEAVITHVKRFSPHLSQHQILEAINLGSGVDGPKGRFWVLDPIDGTKGFLRGDQYAVALALVDGGQVVLGVLGCPNLPVDGLNSHSPRGCLFVAATGEGSVIRGFEDPAERRVHVTKLNDPSQARFCESFESAHSSHEVTTQVAHILGIKIPPLRMDSQAKYGMVSRGDASIYFRLPIQRSYRENIWDHAAGSIIVEEAGGRVTDIQGKILDFSAGNKLNNNRGIIATNGKLHDLLLETVRQVFSQF